MPEGDTIWRTAAAIRHRVSGKIVTDAKPQAVARLTGRRLEGIEATGKHLVMRFEGGFGLHSHMGMTGSWHLYRPGERWREPAWTATVVLEFDDVVVVCFAAPKMELVADAEQPVAHLGPDILRDPFDIDEVITRARASGAGTIGELLLDQRVCAGIGNIYRCESLWLERVDPWLPPQAVDDVRLRRIYRAARDMMRRNLLTPVGRQRHAVHARGGQPCPRCFTLIRIRAQGRMARLTYYCPRCQGQLAGNSQGDRSSPGRDRAKTGQTPAPGFP